MTKVKSKATKFIPVVPGVIHVTGESDVGKTLFALQCGAHPERIGFIDDDTKGRATVDQLRLNGFEFGAYYDLKSETKGLPQLGVYTRCMAIIKELEKKSLDVIVWDTWSRFASTLKPYVRKNMLLFREAKDWASMGQMKGAQQWKEAQELEAQIIARLNVIAPVVILVTHLKDQYIGNRKTGKQIPDASRTITRVPSFRLWLRRNPSGSPVPIALVLKRIAKNEFVAGEGLRTTNILPPRVEPLPGERSVWDAIKRCVADPIGNRALEKHEIPNAFEKSLIDGTLTDDQKRAWMLSLAAAAGEEVKAPPSSDAEIGVAARVTEMRDAGSDDAEIARVLKKEGNSYPKIARAMEVTVKQVVAWCRG